LDHECIKEDEDWPHGALRLIAAVAIPL